MIWYILIGIGALLLVLWIVYFNSFVRFTNKVHGAESDVDVQLKRRFDLLPNLVEIVKGYAKHERELFENIALQRSQFNGAVNTQEKAKAGNEITSLLKNLFVVVENYPELLADKSFINLQNSLIEIEDQIQMSRRYYNAVVRDYNTLVESFPGLVFAKVSGYKAVPFFEIAFLEKTVIQVKLS